MSSVQYLREFVTERLTAAAPEEILGVFGKTLVEYEEEIDQPPRQYICWKEEVLTDQQLCKQERNSILDQVDPEPSQIKEEQEELSSQQGEQLVLKQQTETFMLIPVNKDNDHSEPEPNTDHQLLSHSSLVAESRDQEGSKHRRDATFKKVTVTITL
ncbi:hypothetical protein EXN66_Car014242 [Channa argus]|uniref:Uncharacterized protein n=1 Tax=Channa argus TaxID=215402 RepID=A0A6G1Q7M3_CHAAH|nr:hypothetical protein EXN66_Car014242 [Channa argus]